MTFPDPGPKYNDDGIMTTEFQALTMQVFVGSWVTDRGGSIAILASPKHLWEEIYKVNEIAPRVLICWNGEKSRGGFNQANTLHRVDRQWLVAVIRGHGFKNNMATGRGQSKTPAVVDPFMKHCQIIRDKLRVLVNITEEQPIDYKGMDPIPAVAPYGNSGNVFIDGYAISFSTANDIPAVTDIDPDA